MSKLSHKAEGTFLVEVEHLKSDVSRLLQMLRNTSEYKEFAVKIKSNLIFVNLIYF